MPEKLELPEDLTEDMEVLFINPYDPEDYEEMQLTGITDEKLAEAFHKANARDPGFQHFEDKVGVVKTMLGVGGYVVGDDLILLYGDKDALLKAQESLKGDYHCFFDTVGNFMEHCESDDAVLTIPEQKPTVN